MKAKKYSINSHTQSNKVLTFAGLAIIIVGIIANIFSAFNNKVFVNDPIDLIYYFRYIILLGGGFTIGYLLNKKKATKYDKLFTGVNYAMLTVAFWWVLDLARVSYQNIFGYTAFPWGKIMFEGLPAFTIIIVLVFAYFTQYKPNHTNLSKLAKITLIGSFLIWQIYMFFDGIISLMTGAATFDPNTPIWQIVVSYLTTPIIIAIVSYFIIKATKPNFDRLYYSILIATFYCILMQVLWELRTDADTEATTIFSNIVSVICILFTIILLWLVNKSSHRITTK